MQKWAALADGVRFDPSGSVAGDDALHPLGDSGQIHPLEQDPHARAEPWGLGFVGLQHPPGRGVRSEAVPWEQPTTRSILGIRLVLRGRADDVAMDDEDAAIAEASTSRCSSGAWTGTARAVTTTCLALLCA